MNIVLIVIDTLRASRLGCYGYALPTSPAIDRLAADGVRFARCFAPGIPTTPAHTTIYTGLHPISHRIVCHGGSVDLDRKTPVLPELLQQAGFTTAAADNLYDIKPWLARGYEFYINSSYRHKLRLMVTCEEVNARAIPWLREHAAENFFLFVHYWEPHTPYVPPERYRTFYPADRDPFDPGNTTFEPIKRQPFWDMFADIWFRKLGPVTDRDYVASLYDAQIRHVDDAVAELVSAVDELGLADDTLIVLTGDHGESLGQHDIYFDHHGLYEDVIHVPLIMRAPGTLRPAVAEAMVQHTDLAPTLLEAGGAAPMQRTDGRSVWPIAAGLAADRAWDRVVCCECTWQAKWALRTQDRKLILARQPDRHGMPMRELYDLCADPAEEHNLADERPTEAAELALELEEWIAAGLQRTGSCVDPLMEQGITLGKRWEK